MNAHPSWQYNEMQQIGRDYGRPEEVDAYDRRHGRIRNVEKENEEILERLQLRPDHVVIELGAGTGAFALQAAGKCAQVYAVDISPAMLEYAEKRAEEAERKNIMFRHGGFLSYLHDGPPADAVVTNTALHHLPDFWKGVALKRMKAMLKPGGRLYLSDVIFEEENMQDNIERFMAKLEAAAGPDIRVDIELHLQREFSTYDWIIDGLLERSGFRIDSKTILNGVIGRYLCSTLPG